MKCSDFFMLTRRDTLWPCPLTRWPWKFVVGLMSRGHSLWYVDRNRTIPGWVIHNLANFGPCYITLWPWRLTPWPSTWTIVGASCVQSMFQIWTRSVDPRLSYWRLTTDFSSILGDGPILPGVILKNAWTDLHQIWWRHCSKPQQLKVERSWR